MTPFSIKLDKNFGKEFLGSFSTTLCVNILMQGIPSVTQKKLKKFFANFQVQSKKIKT